MVAPFGGGRSKLSKSNILPTTHPEAEGPENTECKSTRVMYSRLRNIVGKFFEKV